jgi:MFS family permease
MYLMLVELGRIGGALIGGKIADCFGRKPVLIGAQIATSVFLFPCAFLEESLLIPKLLIFAAFFNGAVHPAIDAILVDVSHPANRKEIFSFIYLGLNLGFGIGSLIAGFLYTNFMQLLFLGNVLAILVVTVVIGFYVPETKPEVIISATLDKVKVGPGSDMLNREKSGKMISALLNQPLVFYFFLVSIIFFLVHSQFFFSLPLQIDAIFLEQGPEYFGIVMSFNCLIVVLMTLPITWLSRHNRPVVNVFWSGLLFAIGFGMLRWVSFLGWILLSTFVWTLGEILLRINAGVFIANHSPETLRGRFNSLVTVSGSIGRIIGPPLLGIIIAGFGIRSIWMVIFVLSIAGSILMYQIYRHEIHSKDIEDRE